MHALYAFLAALLPQIIAKMSEPSTKTGAAGLVVNGALAAATPDADPVQLVLQIVLACLQLYDIWRREKPTAAAPAGPQ